MFFELPWVGGAEEDAMAVAISIKYSVCQNPYITFYYHRPPPLIRRLLPTCGKCRTRYPLGTQSNLITSA